MKIIENPDVKDNKYIYNFAKGKKLQGKVVVPSPISITQNQFTNGEG